MIDGGVFLGRNPATGACLEPEKLIAWMDRSCISSVIAAHYKSIFFDFREGNEDLIRISRKYPGRILPAAIINPGGFDLAREGGYLRSLKKDGFRILGFYKNPHYYPVRLESLLVRDIAAAAARAGLILQFGLESAKDISLVSEYYGKIKSPVLIRMTNGRGYSFFTEALRALRSHSSFLLDTGSFASLGAIADLVKTLGAGRLYFSSNIPESFPYTASALLETAGLRSGEKEQISRGTLAKVFKYPAKKENRIVSESPVAKLISASKIDTHWHIDGWNLLEPLKNFRDFEPELRRFHLNKILLSSIRALNYDMAGGNREVFKLAGKEPRVHGLIVVDPVQTERSLAEIENYAAHPKCAGIKTIQDLYGLGLNHSSYEPLLKAAQKYKLTVMAHIPGLLEAAQQYPALTFVCAHSTHERVKSMFKVPNIFFDIATSHSDPVETKLEAFIAQAGIEKILFSSDGPLISPAWTLGKLAGLNLRSGEWDQIFRLNALKAFPRLKSGKTSRKKISRGVLSKAY